jgi:GTP-binding protein
MKSRQQPVVAIIGRPNVGKSTLFNRIIGHRKAGVLPIPGLTRDRNYASTTWNGKKFLLVDTGGYDTLEKDDITLRVREQVLLAIDESDAILFLTEVESLHNPIDSEIMDLLRRCGKKFFLTVNKCDNPELENESYSFSALGLDNIYPISATHGLGVGTLLDAVTEPLAKTQDAIGQPSDEIKIAIVGRQNTGKSTLVNKILGKERVIASPVPGTTRDAVDSPFQIGEKKYLIIDTAGIRRRGKITKGPESLSVTASIMSIQRCDVAILLLDVSEGGSTAQDTHIAGYIHDSGRAAILAVNKWDLVEKDQNTAGSFAKKLKDDFNFLSYAPIIFISALTGQRVVKLFNLVDEIILQYSRKIETSVLNQELENILKKYPPPLLRGHRLRIKYITQTGIMPPTFTLFVNNPELMHFSYKRYMINQFRELLSMDKTPIILKLRRKS